MTIEFEKKFESADLSQRVRAIIGIPEEILEDSVISSPTFKIRASKYVNKKILQYNEEELNNSLELLNISYLYYICYLLCSGMSSRLPKQMENKSTKTIMQNIDWDSKALEMLDKCNDIIDEIISDIDEDFGYGTTFAVLSNTSEYPNTNI